MLAGQPDLMRIVRSLAVLTAMAFAPQVGLAQAPAPAAVPDMPAPAAPKPSDCGPQAATYQAGKGPKLWVLRQGTMVLAENPLRPMSRDEAVVLDVVVNGRRATAFGPDLNHLRQGGSPKSVEHGGREPIRWAEGGVAPAAIRVVAEDGRVLLGPMPFGGCEDAPAAKAVADKPAPAEQPAKGKRKRKEPPAGGESGGAPTHLPQGALDGLSLPKGNR